jgi:hypothetical protein
MSKAHSDNGIHPPRNRAAFISKLACGCCQALAVTSSNEAIYD